MPYIRLWLHIVIITLICKWWYGLNRIENKLSFDTKSRQTWMYCQRRSGKPNILHVWQNKKLEWSGLKWVAVGIREHNRLRLKKRGKEEKHIFMSVNFNENYAHERLMLISCRCCFNRICEIPSEDASNVASHTHIVIQLALFIAFIAWTHARIRKKNTRFCRMKPLRVPNNHDEKYHFVAGCSLALIF